MAEELCVIFNPHSGRGRASRRLEALRLRWGNRAVFWPTEAAGHAEDLALRAAAAGFTVVAAAGGDGTVHEVANGLLRAGRPDVAFAVVPIGSANDYAFSLGVDNGALPAQAERWVDVGVVRDAHGRERSFLCCLGLGFNGKVTLESRRIKRLQGIALYGLATLRALWYHYECPPLSVRIDDQPVVTMPTLMLSVLLGRREGGFVMAPQAELDDGLFDYIHTGDLSRWQVLQLLPRLALAGPPHNHPKVHLGRCRRFVLQSPTPLTAHVDGEFFARPEDDLRDLEVYLRPRALRVRLALGDGR
jgi:diacylglycerol kinase (ATP)